MDQNDAMFSVDFSLQGSTATTSYVTSFSTGDKIEGMVTICSHKNTRFHDISISFLGDEYTEVRHAKAHRQFLNVQYPIQNSSLPESKTFTKDQKYHLEFSFNVPDHLPQSVCDHTTASHAVKQAHLRPPPSFGDPLIAGYGDKLRNDFAPPVCRIVYTIRLEIRHMNPASGRISTTFTKGLKLRIKPATPSQPPSIQDGISSTQNDPHRGGHIIKHGRSKSNLGSLSMLIEEPTRFCLPLRDPITLVNSSVNIHTTYTSNTEPIFPQFKHVEGYLSSTTFFSTKCHENFPEKEKGLFGTALNFDEVQFPPFSCSFTSLDWEHHADDRYAATIRVPVTLPRQNFIPTFHSCLVSRVYTLRLKVVAKDYPVFEFALPAHVFARQDPSHLPSYEAVIGLNPGMEASI